MHRKAPTERTDGPGRGRKEETDELRGSSPGNSGPRRPSLRGFKYHFSCLCPGPFGAASWSVKCAQQLGCRGATAPWDEAGSVQTPLRLHTGQEKRCTVQGEESGN